jgi:hypothetical protein
MSGSVTDRNGASFSSISPSNGADITGATVVVIAVVLVLVVVGVVASLIILMKYID